MSVHNFEISREGREAIRRAWRETAAWAHQDPLRRTFLAAGDFNMSATPSESLLFPLPRQARRSDAGRANVSEPVWRDLFLNPHMLEICPPLPIHFTKNDCRLRTIDRLFISIESSFMVETECDIQIIHDAIPLDTQNLSGHAMMKLVVISTTAGNPLCCCFDYNDSCCRTCGRRDFTFSVVASVQSPSPLLL